VFVFVCVCACTCTRLIPLHIRNVVRGCTIISERLIVDTCGFAHFGIKCLEQFEGNRVIRHAQRDGVEAGATGMTDSMCVCADAN